MVVASCNILYISACESTLGKPLDCLLRYISAIICETFVFQYGTQGLSMENT